MLFMDCSSSYNQICKAPKDEELTTFCTAKGIYNYKGMPFSLKNFGVTYQKGMKNILSHCTMFWLNKMSNSERNAKVIYSRSKESNCHVYCYIIFYPYYVLYVTCIVTLFNVFILSLYLSRVLS